MKVDFWIFVGLLAAVCVLLYAAKHVPQIATGFQQTGDTTCDGLYCGGSFTHSVAFLVIATTAVFGLVALVLATIGQKAKP